MIFLHPVILRDAQEGTLRTNDKYSYIRQQQFTARQRGVALLPEVETPLLAPPEQVKKYRTLSAPFVDEPLRESAPQPARSAANVPPPPASNPPPAAATGWSSNKQGWGNR
jgi:hypothetical protein